MALLFHRAPPSVVSSSNLLPDIPGSTLSTTIIFSFLSVIYVTLNLSSAPSSYSLGPALEVGLGRSISSLLRARLSPLLQASLLQALVFIYI